MSQNLSIRVGISHCLLGAEVRYNGGHKLDRYLRDQLGAYVTSVPVCPEAECGLPIPREAMRLVGDIDNPRLVTVRTGIDHTRRMRNWAAKRIRELRREDLCGYVFKTRSPSSAMRDAKVYNAKGGVVGRGPGIFARAFLKAFPLLPVEDEGRLHDDGLRENFVERVFAYARFREYERTDGRRGGLVSFHADHKLLLMAHSPSHARELGRIVAHAKGRPIGAVRQEYLEVFLTALKRIATVRKHVNVLQHCAGYFKRVLDSDEKQELQEVIEQYHRELAPLVVPLTLIAHHVRRFREPYLARQYYLHPHPAELKLRNHV